eukprot:IDg10940t1
MTKLLAFLIALSHGDVKNRKVNLRCLDVSESIIAQCGEIYRRRTIHRQRIRVVDKSGNATEPGTNEPCTKNYVGGYSGIAEAAQAARNKSSAEPILVIDLEAKVVVKEIGSNGQGISPSDATRKWTPKKQEYIYAMLPLCSAVIEERLRGALRAPFIARLLSRLSFTLVGERESYKVLVEFIREVKAVQNRPSAKRPKHGLLAPAI